MVAMHICPAWRGAGVARPGETEAAAKIFAQLKLLNSCPRLYVCGVAARVCCEGEILS